MPERLTLRARTAALALLVAAPLLAACATGGGSARRVEGETVSIQIRNDLRPGAEVTVRISSTNGVRRVLGTVPPQGTRTLTYDEGSLTGQYRLSAQTSDGREVESRPFPLFGNASVVWVLFNNTLNVSGAG